MFLKSNVPTQRCGTASGSTTVEKEYAICEDSGMIAIEGVCPRIIYKKMGEGENIPTRTCTIHKKASVSPSATPTPSTSTTPKPSASASPSTPPPSPKDTTKPSPSASANPSPNAGT